MVSDTFTVDELHIIYVFEVGFNSLHDNELRNLKHNLKVGKQFACRQYSKYYVTAGGSIVDPLAMCMSRRIPSREIISIRDPFGNKVKDLITRFINEIRGDYTVKELSLHYMEYIDILHKSSHDMIYEAAKNIFERRDI